MKKTFIYLSMLAMTFGFVACSNDDDVTEQTVQQQDNMMVITASLDDNITRTSLGNEGTVVWSEGDYIIIPSKNLGNPPTIFNLISGAGETTATFRGEKLSDGDVTYDAYYGVDAEMYLPSEQVYDAAKKISKAPMHASVTVSGGQVDASTVKFKNLCGLLKISLPQMTGVSIGNIKMTASQPLSGNFTLTTGKEINKLTNSSNTIVLNCGSGVDLSDGSKDFYIYVPANDYGGVKFVFTTTDGLTCTKTLKSTSTINVVSSKITPITFSTVSFSNVPSVDDSYAVDLGLSVKWASKNIGAENNYDSGDYFAWGEVASKTNFTQQNYVWYNSSTKLYTNYCNEDNYGNITKQTTLDTSDDAAVVNWGGKWRMPTLKEWNALIDSCFWVRTNNYNGKGVGGYIIYKVDEANKDDRGYLLAQTNNKNEEDQTSTGKSGVEYHSGKWQERVGGFIIPKYEEREPSTHIFIPFAGHMEGAQKKNNSGSTLYMEHWIPTLSTTENANSYRGINESLSVNAMQRYYGQTIRPVLPND